MPFQDVLEAHKRIADYIHKTPVFTCSTIDRLCGRNVYFKAESLQKTGSFKARGALNAMLCYKEKDPQHSGVTTHSSGNHGLALAWASQHVGVPCTVVVPRDTPKVKRDAIQGYGASVVLCEPTLISRQDTCSKLSQESNLLYVPSANAEDVIAGQGTISVELLEQVPELDAIFVSIGGGGMTAGISIATKAIKPTCKVFAVEPVGKELEKSLRAGRMLWEGHKYLDTIAEGIRVQPVGDVDWPYLLKNVEKDVFTVPDSDIVTAMKLVFERMKLVIETSAAATVAAVMSDKMKVMDPNIKNVGVILCGGNVDPTHLPWM